MKRVAYGCILALVLVVGGCRTPLDDDSSGDITSSPGVPNGGTDSNLTSGAYVAGYINDGTREVASYWVVPGGEEETQRVVLGGVPEGAGSRANAVYVDGEDVYVAGYYLSGTERRAVYWRNGEMTELSTVDSEATGIVIAAGEVYVSGLLRGNPGEGVYWRDGVETAVRDAVASMTVSGITVSGATVVASGWYDNGTTPFTASMWVDDGAGDAEEVDLSLGVNSEASDVRTGANGDYYVAGSFFNGQSFASAYWVVDAVSLAPTRTTLTSVEAGGSWSKAFAIATANGNVYTAGYFSESGSETPAYWENQTRVALPMGSAGRALGIAVESGSVQVAGYSMESGIMTAVLWTDGEKLVLPDQGTEAEARAVVVR